jgi:hypothetical protein
MATRTERNAAIRSALRTKFAAPEWAFFEEVPDGTGATARRRADGLAVALWPSRGLEWWGIEIKVDRIDLKNEIAAPAKADALGRFCDRWWLVVDDEKIFEGQDVPLAWGILVLKSGKFRTHREAAKLEPQAMTRSMTASLIRRVHEWTEERMKGCVRSEDLEAEVARRVEIDKASIAMENDPGRLRVELDRLRKWEAQVREATGLGPWSERDLPNLTKVLSSLSKAAGVTDLDYMEKRAAEGLAAIRKANRELSAIRDAEQQSNSQTARAVDSCGNGSRIEVNE